MVNVGGLFSLGAVEYRNLVAGIFKHSQDFIEVFLVEMVEQNLLAPFCGGLEIRAAGQIQIFGILVVALVAIANPEKKQRCGELRSLFFDIFH